MTVLIILLVLALGFDAYIYYNIIFKKEKSKISFKEGLDLVNLPVVTLFCDSKKLHFLLDTGSNISFINREVLNLVHYTECNTKSKTVGVGGNDIETNHYNLTISYKDQVFVEEFGALDLSEAFGKIKEESGVEIHGILGSQFFEKYKYILDFKDLTAYR